MDLLDVLKLLGGAGALFGVLGVSLFGLSKFRNSSLNKKFSKIVDEVTTDKDKIHELEIDAGKKEQQKVDTRQQISKVDENINKIDQAPSKTPTNDLLLEMFDKLSKK